MSETVDEQTLTAADEADLIQLFSGDNDGDADNRPEPPAFHTILEVWREVLKPIAEEKTKPVTPQWASRMVGTYTGITFDQMLDFRDLYFSMMEDQLQILLDEIESDVECLNYQTPEEDAEHNRHHYINVLTGWQVYLLTVELEWHCKHPYAAVQIGVMSEVHKALVSETGLIAFLDNIQFQFVDTDREQLAAILEETKDKVLSE